MEIVLETSKLRDIMRKLKCFVAKKCTRAALEYIAIDWLGNSEISFRALDGFKYMRIIEDCCVIDGDMRKTYLIPHINISNDMVKTSFSTSIYEDIEGNVVVQIGHNTLIFKQDELKYPDTDVFMPTPVKYKLKREIRLNAKKLSDALSSFGDKPVLINLTDNLIHITVDAGYEESIVVQMYNTEKTVKQPTNYSK